MDGAGVDRSFARRVPILGWLPTYGRPRLRTDLVAGLVVAALVVPQALGYAAIAGVPVQVGLYAIPLALLAYAVFGSSRQLVVGPVSTVSVLSGSLVVTQAHGDPSLAVPLTVGFALAAGLVLVVAGLLNLGWTAEFLSKPIVTGFVFGLTVVIVVGELPNLLGVPGGTGDAFHRLLDLAGELDQVDGLTVAVSVVSLLVLFAGSRLVPRVPWGLLVLVAGIAVSESTDLASRGVATVGPVPEGLPTPSFPDLPLDLWPGVLFGGAALALVGLAEHLAAARLFAQTGGYPVDSDQELLAAGAANVGAGLSGGMGVAGSLSKTAAADRAGGRSQVVGLSSALVVVVVLVAFVGSIAPLPKAVLSAIVVQAVWGLMDVAAIRRYRQVRRNDFVACMAALGGVLLLGTLYGLLAAIGQSVLGLVYRSGQVGVAVMGRVHGEKAAWGNVARHPERTTVPGVLVLRLDSPIFWVNAADVRRRVLETLDAHPGTYALVLDLESTNQLDTTSADMLGGLLDDLQLRRVDLYLVRVFHFVRGVLRSSGFEERLGPGRMWHSISQGVRAAKALATPEELAAALDVLGVEDAEVEADEHIAVHDEPAAEDAETPGAEAAGAERPKAEPADAGAGDGGKKQDRKKRKKDKVRRQDQRRP